MLLEKIYKKIYNRKAKMAIQLVLQIILAVVVFIQGASATSIAKPGCPETCGNVTISYPFGIGTGCSAVKSFEIYCDNTFNPPKPFLNYSNLEVLNISPEYSTIQVNSPVLKDCTNGSNIEQVISLFHPFTYSRYKNQFTAMGCDSLALMTQNGLNIGGCMPFCGDTVNENSCYGINCCQTRIPTVYNNMSTSLKSTISGDNGPACRYVFIVEQKWFLNLTDIYSVQQMKHVPAVLDWTLNASCLGDNGLCGVHASCQTSYDMTGSIMCYCPIGYNGNPYLPDGCQGTILQ